MQRMDSLDSPKKKIVFQKRSHRPWSPAVEENTSALLEYNSKLNSFDNDRLLIGGFSFPTPSLSSYESEQSPKSLALLDELKNKEQEIQELSTNLKIASALEHAEKIELSRKREAHARQAAEEKALFATQQVKLAEEQLQKARQQIQIEQQLKSKEETLKKTLETEIKNAMTAIEDNENTLAQEVELRKIAEEKLNGTLKFLSEKENVLRLEAEKIVKDNLRDFIQQEKNIEQSFEDRLSVLKHEQREQILEIQAESSQKIAQAKEKAQLHEKTSFEMQQHLQASRETISQLEAEKTATEHNLAAAIQHATEQKLELEMAIKNYKLNIQQLDEKINNMAIANVELKKQLSDTISKLNATERAEIESATKINDLNLQVKALAEKVATLTTTKAELTTQLTDSLGKSKILQSIGNNERQLRKILEEKLSDSGIRKVELNKKLFENKILELAERIAVLEVEKSQAEEKHHDALENTHKIEILASAETAVKKSLEEKNKMLSEQIFDLEYTKQKEMSEKETAEYKVLELVAQQEHLEKEKALITEKNSQIMLHNNQLEITLGNEKSISKNLEEALSIVTKQQHLLEHEKVSAEQKFDHIHAYANELEFKLNDEKNVRISIESNLEYLSHQKQILEKEKEALQEKVATLEQANKTVLNVLSNYATTTGVTNAET